MAGVLTEESIVTCGHKPGRVNTAGNEKMIINHHPVLLKNGIEGKSITYCPIINNAHTETVKCTFVQTENAPTISNGEATKLTIGGDNAVMLDTLAGGTNGKINGTSQMLLSSAAVQTKLTSV